MSRPRQVLDVGERIALGMPARRAGAGEACCYARVRSFVGGGVAASAAVEHVRAFAANKGVVAGPALQSVGSGPACKAVIPVPAFQRVAPDSAGQDIIAGAAFQRVVFRAAFQGVSPVPAFKLVGVFIAGQAVVAGRPDQNLNSAQRIALRGAAGSPAGCEAHRYAREGSRPGRGVAAGSADKAVAPCASYQRVVAIAA